MICHNWISLLNHDMKFGCRDINRNYLRNFGKPLIINNNFSAKFADLLLYFHINFSIPTIFKISIKKMVTKMHIPFI